MIAALRAMVDRCEELADELDAGRAGPEPLTREIARLRLAFDAHHRLEARLEARRPARRGPLRLAEHRAPAPAPGSPATSPLRETLALLRAHLAAEERPAPALRVLRD